MTEPEAPMARIVPAGPRRGRRWLPWATAGLVVLLVGLGTAWWFLRASPVRNTFGGFGVSVDRSAPGTPMSLGIAHLCLDGADDATVDDVTADPTGLTVLDFAVRPVPTGREAALSSADVPLRDLGFGGDRRITGACDVGEAVELGVELTRGEFAPAYTAGFDVHWTAGDRSGVLRVPVQVALCTPQEGAELCEEWLEEVE